MPDTSMTRGGPSVLRFFFRRTYFGSSHPDAQKLISTAWFDLVADLAEPSPLFYAVVE